MFRYDLNIAQIPLRLETDQNLLWEEPYLPFAGAEQAPRYRAVFRRVDVLPPIPDRVLLERPCDRIHPDGQGGYIRSFFDAPRSTDAYAVARCDYPAGEIRVDYLEKGSRCVSQMSNSFFHIGFEGLLKQEGKFCLHAACVNTALGGLLFSGPSGMGKSTQADLWVGYRNALQINGDRPILGKKQGVWTAWGSPYAGSSHCHVNKSCPISAIIMLEEWGECRLRRLPFQEAFRKVYSGLTMYPWDEGFTAAAFDFAVELAAQVPVYGFRCTPDEESVLCLEQAFKEGAT